MLGRVAIAVTSVCATLFLVQSIGKLTSAESVGGIVEQSVFIFFCICMLYGSFVYQFSRLGYVRRGRTQESATPEDTDSYIHGETDASAVYLIPSYKEDERVIWQTVVSAVLQDHGNRRVVLLIDDPPDPSDAESRASLAYARQLPEKVNDLLRPQIAACRRLARGFARRQAQDAVVPWEEARRLANAYANIAAWIRSVADAYESNDHTDRWFVDRVLLGTAHLHLETARRWRNYSGSDHGYIHRAYQQLQALFDVEITSFERKRYVNLSHAPNKAMNLNSYISLLGNHYVETQDAQGLHLLPSDPIHATHSYPSAEYIITIDADTLLMPGYAKRLLGVMTAPGNERLAVAQTPYNAIPGPDSIVERVAGATTDIQYITHQGFTHYGATYWVGANAVLRKDALDGIREVKRERGFVVATYIQDRTVIEDTESTVDLIAKGWSLYNHPERLSYSATPPDFGSLLIQRRRWANGGLLIVPKLLRYLWNTTKTGRLLGEMAMRFHYLASIALINIGYLALLFYPFEDPLHSLWLPLAVVPYFYLYGRDLVQSGYRWLDLPRVYALNLLLIPINLGGVFRSLYQGVTGRHFPFGRTPKVHNRTAAPGIYVVVEMILLLWFAAAAAFDLSAGRYVHAVCSILNGAFLAYAFHSFIGMRSAVQDVLLGCSQWLAGKAQSLSVASSPQPAHAVPTSVALPPRSSVRPPVPDTSMFGRSFLKPHEPARSVCIEATVITSANSEGTMPLTLIE